MGNILHHKDASQKGRIPLRVPERAYHISMHLCAWDHGGIDFSNLFYCVDDPRKGDRYHTQRSYIPSMAATSLAEAVSSLLRSHRLQKRRWLAHFGGLLERVGKLNKPGFAKGTAHEGEANGQAKGKTSRDGNSRIASQRGRL